MDLINENEYDVIDHTEFDQKLNESDFDLALRTSELYKKSTHWLCEETDLEDGICQKGEIYPFIFDGEEFVIVLGKGLYSMIWMLLDGHLLVKK